MRTTLTLDDDVAAALAQIRRTRGGRFKTLVNAVLRQGLEHTCAKPTHKQRFQTTSVDLGALRVGTLDNVGDALAIAEQAAKQAGQLLGAATS